MEVVAPNSQVELLKQAPWPAIHQAVGDAIMLRLLLHVSIFWPLPNGCYLQLTGPHIFQVKQHRLASGMSKLNAFDHHPASCLTTCEVKATIAVHQHQHRTTTPHHNLLALLVHVSFTELEGFTSQLAVSDLGTGVATATGLSSGRIARVSCCWASTATDAGAQEGQAAFYRTTPPEAPAM